MEERVVFYLKVVNIEFIDCFGVRRGRGGGRGRSWLEVVILF